MTRRIQIVAVAGALVVVLAGVGTFAFAQGPGGFRGRGPMAGPRAGLPLEALNLTDAQREQVRQLMQQHREQTRPLVDRLRAAHEAQRQAVEAIPADEARIRAATGERAAVEAELAVHRARLQADVYALLTPEQQQRAQQLRAEREARLKLRRNRR